MSDLRTLAVVGAGNMGSGIAQKMATEGFRVLLVDLNQAAVDRGLANIAKTLDEGVARKIFKPEQAEGIKSAWSERRTGPNSPERNSSSKPCSKTSA